MRAPVTLSVLAVAATAFVVPDTKLFADPDLEVHRSEAQHVVDDVASAALGTFDQLSHWIQSAAPAGEDSLDQIFEAEELFDGDPELESDLEDLGAAWDGHPRPPPRHPHPPHRRPGRKPHRPHRPHCRPNLTIYEMISRSEHTSKFAKLVAKYDSIVEILNTTSANFTLFVPTNEALKKIPHHGDGDHDKNSSSEFIEAALKYHITGGLNSAVDIMHSHTLPTTYKEKWLGGHPQRLRTRGGPFGGLHVNFYSKVVLPNIPAKNGVIHAINLPLFPPPMVGKILSLVPQHFSTLLLAYEKTDFVKYIHNVPMNGSTVFAPTNDAFTRLGPNANAFLFNTETGLKYLKALLKYQIVANATLYSDAYYESETDGQANSAPSTDANQRYHVDLPTLLGPGISVNISRWGPWIRLKVNGYVPVSVQDVLAKNGVIQVVGRVPFPPRKPGGGGDEAEVDEDEMDLEDLKARLADYLEDADKPKQEGDDWNEL